MSPRRPGGGTAGERRAGALAARGRSRRDVPYAYAYAYACPCPAVLRARARPFAGGHGIGARDGEWARDRASGRRHSPALALTPARAEGPRAGRTGSCPVTPVGVRPAAAGWGPGGVGRRRAGPPP